MAETGDHFSVFDGYNSTEMRECDCGATRTPSSGPMCTTAATFQIVSNSSKEASVIHNSHRQGSNGCRLHQAHLACLMIAAVNTTYLEGMLKLILWIINFNEPFSIGFKHWVHMALVILYIIREIYFAPDESVVGLAPSIIRSSIPLDVTAETNPNIIRRNKIFHGGNYWDFFLMTSDPDPELSNGPKYFAVECSWHVIKQITNFASYCESISWHLLSRIVSNCPKESSDVHSNLHQGSKEYSLQAYFACLMRDTVNATYLEGSSGLNLWTANYYKPFCIGFQHWVDGVMGTLSIIQDPYFAYVESGLCSAPSILRSSKPLAVTAETNLDIHKFIRIYHGGNYWAGFDGHYFIPQSQTIYISSIEGRILFFEPFVFIRCEIQGVESGVPAELSHVMEPNFSLGFTNYTSIQSQNILGGAAPSTTNQVDGKKI